MQLKNLKELLKQANKQKTKSKGVVIEPYRIALFSPAIFFLILGLGVVFAPKFLFTIFAGILLFFALGFGFLAWKVMTLKSKFEKVRKGFKAKVFVNSVGGSGFSSFQGSRGVEELFNQLTKDTDLKSGDINLNDLSFDDELTDTELFESENLSAEDMLRKDLGKRETVTKIKSEDGKTIEVIDKKKIVFH